MSDMKMHQLIERHDRTDTAEKAAEHEAVHDEIYAEFRTRDVDHDHALLDLFRGNET